MGACPNEVSGVQRAGNATLAVAVGTCAVGVR